MRACVRACVCVCVLHSLQFDAQHDHFLREKNVDLEGKRDSGLKT